MNYKIKFIAAVCLVLVIFTLSFQKGMVKTVSTPQFYSTENIIVLVIDGVRFSETFGDSTHKYIPHLYNDIVPKGSLFTHFYNNGTTTTVSGHTAITTGVYQNLKNNGLVFPKNPSFFQYYLKEKPQNKDNAWVISSKGKLNILSNCKDKKWKDLYQPMSFCGGHGSGDGYTSDIFTWGNVKRIMKDYHPKTMLINLLEVDVMGHSNDWEGYLKAIQTTDSLAYELVKYIETDSFYSGKTTLFITNDHGRHLDGHKDGFVNHGDHCEGCKHIYCIGIGPDFKQNQIIEKPYGLIDISKTISNLMNFDMPTSKGKNMVELYK